MSTFDEREKGFEAKYRHDQETQFKIGARRNRLLGMWAAEKLGLSGGEAEAYAKQVVAADFEKPGDSDVLDKVVADFQAKGVALGAGEVRKEMDRLISVAREQVLAEKKG